MAEDKSRQDQFLRLFAANESALRAHIRCLLPSRNDTYDVSQDIALVLLSKYDEFLVLWRNHDQSEEQTVFRKWAFCVARFQVLAWRRNKARDRHVFDEDVLELIADEAQEHEESLSAQRDALESCLKKLSQAERELLLKAYTAGADTKELAQQSGRTHGGFYQWLYRMRKLLLDCTRRAVAMENLP